MHVSLVVRSLTLIVFSYLVYNLVLVDWIRDKQITDERVSLLLLCPFTVTLLDNLVDFSAKILELGDELVLPVSGKRVNGHEFVGFPSIDLILEAVILFKSFL